MIINVGGILTIEPTGLEVLKKKRNPGGIWIGFFM
jgi:hypothetical protein